MTHLKAALNQRGYFFLLALLSMLFGTATAQPLEDVTLRYSEKGVVARITMTSPVQYLRHNPAKRGRTLEIYYDRAPGATLDEEWVNNEVRKSPPSSLIPSFTVTTRNQKTKPKLVIKFKRTANYTVSQGKDGHTLLVTIRPYKQSKTKQKLRKYPVIYKAKVFPPDADPALVGVSQNARSLMIKGRNALRDKKYNLAVSAFNQLLLLPPNEYSQSAQEWVGVARERAGQINKAKVEYELYLTLYPTGKGMSVVRQRLANLSGKRGEKVKMGDEGDKNKPKQAARLTTYGGITTRYYWGSSTVDTSFIFNNVQTSDSNTNVDQSALVTNVDATARYTTAEYDNRLVFRNVVTQDFINHGANFSRIHSAYADVKARKSGYSLRAGRQSPSQSGVLGRFDGISGEYEFSGGFAFMEGLRIKASTGVVTDYSNDEQPKFKAASWEKGMFSGYYVSQELEGFLDRRAVGGEFRYYDKGRSAYVLIDYDIYFRELNTILLSGSQDIGNGTTVNVLLDHRRAPTLSVRSALTGAPIASIALLRQSMTAEELRDLAKRRTRTSNFAQLGVNRKLTDKWQVGGELKLSSISALAESGATNTPQGHVNAIEETGIESNTTVRAVGNSLLKRNDVLSSSITYLSGKTRDAYSIYAFYQMQVTDRWVWNLSMMRYIQEDSVNGKLTRTSPMFRASYRFSDRLTADADVGVDYTKSDGVPSASGPPSNNIATRPYFSMGARWDF